MRKGKLTILIVEDNSGLAELIGSVLADAGKSMAFAASGEQALAWLQGHVPNLIIMDYSLPDMKAGTIQESLAARGIAVPFIIITGQGDERIAVDMMKAGARDYLVKDAALLDRLPMVVNRVLREIENENRLNTMESVLRETEKRYRQALEAVRDGLWECNVQNRTFIFTSPRVLEMRGYRPDELTWDYDTMCAHIHPDDLEYVLDMTRAHINGEKPEFKAEYRTRTKQNTWVWILSRGRIIVCDEAGQPEIMIGTDTDITDRKHVQEILRQSEERYRTLIESAPFPVLISGLSDGRLRYFNALALKRFGLDPEDALNTLAADYFADPHERELLIQELKRQGSVVDHEVCLKTRTGELFWVLFSATIISFGDEEAVFAAYNDVTARKQAAEKLRESEAKYRLLAEKMNDVVWTTDLNLKTTYVSPSIERTLGYTPEERANQQPQDQLTPESLERVQRLLVSELERDNEHPDPDRSLTVELEYIRKDGSHVAVENVLSAIRDESGAIIGIHGVSRDLSERRRAEAALRESERKYRLLAEQMNDMVWTMDLNLRTTYVSPSVVKLLGFTSDERLEHGPGQQIVPESLEKTQKLLLQEIARDGQEGVDPNRGIPLETEVIRKDGRTIWVENVVSFLRDEAGTIIGIHGVSRDISERRRVEEALRRSEARFREMFEGHDAIMLLIAPDTGAIVDANPSAIRFYGYSRETLCGMRIDDINQLSPDEIAEERRNAELHRRNYFVFPHRLADGRNRFVEVHSSPLDIAGKRLLFSIIHDITERKQAEEALSASEAKYRFLTEKMNDIVWTSDLNLNITYVSPSIERVTGYTPEERMLLSFDDRLAPDSQSAFHEQLARELNLERSEKGNTNRAVTMEAELFHKNGSKVWLENVVSAIRDEQGAIIGLHGVSRDITIRKQIERTLKEQLHFTQTLIETIASPVFYKDAAGRYLGCNHAFAAYQMLEPEDIIGKTVFENASPEYAQIYHQMDRVLIEQGGTQIYEAKVYHHGLGQEREVLITKSVFQDAGGINTGIVGLMVDITDRKKSEEAIALAKQDWERTFDAVPDLIAIIGSDHRITRMNAAMAEYFGRCPDDCLGESCFRLMHGANYPPDYCPHVRLLKTGLEQTAEIHDERTGKDLLITCSPLHDSSGALIGCVHVARDVTEQKLAEAREKEHIEQLMQADKMVALGTLVSGMAHEINNPNNFIMLNAKILSQAWADAMIILDRQLGDHGDFIIAKTPYSLAKDKIAGFIDGIAEGSRRIKDIVQNLKNFSRPERSEFKQNIDVNMVVNSAVELMANLISKTTNHFAVEYGSEIPSLYGNYQRLEQVVINLIQNACESLTDDQKSVVVRTRYDAEARQICIELADQGEGIPKENQKFIMNPFFTTKRDQGGTGLGLSISSRIIEDHHGTITVNSEPGLGTIVIVRLPSGQTQEQTHA